MNNHTTRSVRQRDRWTRTQGPRLSGASLLLIGLIVGLGVALYYAWIVEPVVFTEASPARLNDRYKEEYLLLISQSYEVDGNWDRAENRLVALGEEDPAQFVADKLEEFLRRGEDAATIDSVARLAAGLGVQNPAVAAFGPQPTITQQNLSDSSGQGTIPEVTPTLLVTRLPEPTLTPVPSPSPTPVPAFRLLSREQVCMPNTEVTRIEVNAVDTLLAPLPGAEVIVTWDGGSDHFYTGFKPEISLGYGDFEMSPDTNYAVEMAEGSQVVEGLQIETCPIEEGGLPGGWRLTFQFTKVVQAESR